MKWMYTVQQQTIKQVVILDEQQTIKQLVILDEKRNIAWACTMLHSLRRVRPSRLGVSCRHVYEAKDQGAPKDRGLQRVM